MFQEIEENKLDENCMSVALIASGGTQPMSCYKMEGILQSWKKICKSIGDLNSF